MKRILSYGMIIFSFIAFTSAAAADDTYIGIDFSSAKLDLPKTSGTIGMIRGRFGVIMLPETSSKFGFESHLAFGLDSVSATRTVTGVSEEIELELESILGLYMRAEFFSAGIVGFYGLVGFAAAQTGPALQAVDGNGNLQFEASDPVYNEDSSSGPSIGLGLTIFVAKSVSIQVETLQVHSSQGDRDFDVSSVSVGVNIEL